MNVQVTLESSDLVPLLLAKNEAAFLQLIEKHQSSMLRVCQIFVDDPEAAQEVVQDTWLDLVKGLEHFEGRSSLKTWLFTILTNKAKTRAAREHRSIPFADLETLDINEDEPAVDPERFLPSGHPWAGHWAAKPRPWDRSIEEEVLSKELLETVSQIIEELPESQHVVVTMRDIEGWTSEEVCNVLGLTETNQRVLLHRARSRIRRALEGYFDQKAGTA